MQTLYAIHVNIVGKVSVDCYSLRHCGAAKWRVYFSVTPATVARLRAIYRKHPERFYISRQWSKERWRLYREWTVGDPVKGWRQAGVSSLDSLATSGQ